MPTQSHPQPSKKRATRKPGNPAPLPSIADARRRIGAAVCRDAVARYLHAKHRYDLFTAAADDDDALACWEMVSFQGMDDAERDLVRAILLWSIPDPPRHGRDVETYHHPACGVGLAGKVYAAVPSGDARSIPIGERDASGCQLMQLAVFDAGELALGNLDLEPMVGLDALLAPAGDD